MLGSDLCDCIDAYIFVKGRINIRATANTGIEKKVLILKIMLGLYHA